MGKLSLQSYIPRKFKDILHAEILVEVWGFQAISKFNERKLQVLSYIASVYSTTPWQMAKDLRLEIHNARMLLKKYYKYGLLNREKCSTGEFCYWLTREGKKRLDYLRSFS